MPRTILTLPALILLVLPLSAQPKFDPPKTFPPDAATLKQIETKTAELRKAVAALPKGTPDDVTADVAVYAKAAEWVARHGEWFQKDSAKQTLAVLDAGLERAKAAARGKTPWRDVRGKPIIRGYWSLVDGSVQPYSVILPVGFGEKGKRWRMDTVLHGRGQTLTEVSFIYSHERAKPAAKELDYVILEPYGRGNNAYRWAGEADVLEAEFNFDRPNKKDNYWSPIDSWRQVLRGFSMGGAGTWHIGLHHPFQYAVIGPGAGFTTTHGYIKNLPAKLPDYQEKCLRIYDAIDYAENAFNVPVVAYSGEKDPQKAAADNIAARLKGFEPPARFTHLVAPGLAHRMPPEWQAKAEAEYRKHLAASVAREKRGEQQRIQERVHFVTYTTQYPEAGFARVVAMDRHYERAVVDAHLTRDRWEIKTANVRGLRLMIDDPPVVTIDGQAVAPPARPDKSYGLTLVKKGGKWSFVDREKWTASLRAAPQKVTGLQGPIDDAFMEWFRVIGPTGEGWHPAVTRYAATSLDRFGKEWDRFLRGRLPTSRAEDALSIRAPGTIVLFGDPGSNRVIADLIDKLPITWTKDRLVVNGVEYDPKTHVPVMIFPNPKSPKYYVVINSGHTFHAADFKGTNALLYPRLGDWAVLKPTPTVKDPAAAVVVAAGLFDEFWQFPVKADAPTEELKSFAAPGAKLEKLWGDGEFTEGPTAGPDGAIYFSDIGNRILRFDPKTGKTTTYRDPSGRSNGLKFDAEGRLIACEGANTGGNRRISITEKDGKVRTLADKWNGKRFNSPNDLALDTKGRVYFTDPRYVGTESREIDTESVYRIDPDGTVTKVIADVSKPNGIVIAPDGKTLYLAETNAQKKRQLLAFPLRSDGTVGAKKVLYDFGDDRGIDGMTVTADGQIVATAGRGKTAGVYLITPEGKKVGFVPTPEAPSNCCFGGPGSKSLYITAGKSLYRIELVVAGR
ncbi:MAG TPA: SMP-30/gluconolactonase/LRE family protein [Fimbriiglobus sp.]|nr:SMP-30/gluconolactonase/LRE family protein [Fimbriiglobus sp.]